METRPIEAADAPALQKFFQGIPEGDRTFFKEDITDPNLTTNWNDDTRSHRIASFDDNGAVAGYLAIIPGIGWESHVGELRLVVDPGHRRQGVGRDLARRGLLEAIEMGLGKVFVEVVADQTAAVSMFQNIGFEAEALLRNHVRDRNGELRDLMMLAHSKDDTWSTMATFGIDEEVS